MFGFHCHCSGICMTWHSLYVHQKITAIQDIDEHHHHTIKVKEIGSDHSLPPVVPLTYFSYYYKSLK